MSEPTNVERGASGALEWEPRIRGWYPTDESIKRSAVEHGWHGPSVFYCLEYGVQRATAYSVADAQRWVLEGVLP
jgi:hypothetical protein